eukprot:2250622-Rhodomonas_salina.1
MRAAQRSTNPSLRAPEERPARKPARSHCEWRREQVIDVQNHVVGMLARDNYSHEVPATPILPTIRVLFRKIKLACVAQKLRVQRHCAHVMSGPDDVGL